MNPLPRSLLASLVLLVVAVVSLGSFAYPLVTAPLFRTDTIVSTTTSTSPYWSTMSTTVGSWVQYSTSTGQTVIYNFLCDPASNACTPTMISYTTQTLSTYQVNTQISRITMTTQWVSTNEFESTNTTYTKIPAYASVGMSDSQFFMLAGIVILVLVGAIVGTFMKTRGIAKPHQAQPSQLNGRRTFCVNCGTQLPSGSRFCTKCGSEQT